MLRRQSLYSLHCVCWFSHSLSRELEEFREKNKTLSATCLAEKWEAAQNTELCHRSHKETESSRNPVIPFGTDTLVFIFRPHFANRWQHIPPGIIWKLSPVIYREALSYSQSSNLPVPERDGDELWQFVHHFWEFYCYSNWKQAFKHSNRLFIALS